MRLRIRTYQIPVLFFHVWPDERLSRITAVFLFFLRFQHTPVGSPPAAADAGAALRLHIGNRYCAALPFVVLFYCCCVGPVTSQTTAFSLRFLAAGYSMFDLVLVLSGIFAVCVFFLFLFWPPSHTALLPLHALLF